MDIDLVEAAIKYHGKQLYDVLAKANELEPAQDSLIYSESALSEPTCSSSSSASERELSYQTSSELATHEEDKWLYKRLIKFIVSKSDYLFNERHESESWGQQQKTKTGDSTLFANDEEAKAVEFDLAPIETFMEVPLRARKDHLFQYIEPGDVVIGCIDQVIEAGIYMNLICFDNFKRRDLSRIDLTLFCPYYDAMKSAQVLKNAVKQPQMVYFKNDLIRCLVVNIDKEKNVCIVSLVENGDDFLELGTIKPEEIPSYHQNIEYYREEPYTFSKDLKRERAFNNPACVNLLLKKLNLRPTWASNYSLMPSLNNVKIAREEMADKLLKTQNKILALQSVEKGVRYFKEDRNIDAMSCFKKAISIDEESVEAYVARGALYANEGDLDKAIDDFEKALKLDSEHSNAKKYLKEVFLNYSIKMEKRENYEEAIVYLKKALEIDAQNELIKEKIKNLTKKIDEMFRKNMYGPSLPSEIPPRRKRSRTRSSRSRSASSSDESVKIIKKDSKSSSRSSLNEKSSNNNNNNNNNNYSRSVSSSASIGSTRTTTTTEANSSKQSSSKNGGKDDNDDDDEDLEDFYLKLKQNKAKAKK